MQQPTESNPPTVQHFSWWWIHGYACVISHQTWLDGKSHVSMEASSYKNCPSMVNFPASHVWLPQVSLFFWFLWSLFLWIMFNFVVLKFPLPLFHEMHIATSRRQNCSITNLVNSIIHHLQWIILLLRTSSAMGWGTMTPKWLVNDGWIYLLIKNSSFPLVSLQGSAFGFPRPSIADSAAVASSSALMQHSLGYNQPLWGYVKKQ